MRACVLLFRYLGNERAQKRDPVYDNRTIFRLDSCEVMFR